MIRSFFIGFLILSTLTAKGAGVQIAASACGSVSALRDIISAVSPHADKTAGTSGESSRFSSCNRFNSLNSHLLTLSDGSSDDYIVVPSLDGDTCLIRFEGICDSAASSTDEGMYCCSSGLSPPSRHGFCRE